MRIWGVIALVLLTAVGCSSRFLYNHIDWVVIDYIEDYVDLTKEQERWVSERVDVLTAWHRSEEIPRYIQQLDALIEMDPRTLTVEEFKQQEAQIQQHIDRLVERLIPEIHTLLTQLDDEQVEELMNGIRVRHSKFKKKYQNSSEDEIRDRYFERVSESFENWIGDFSSEQKRIAKEWVTELNITTFDWIAHQTLIRVELKRLFATRYQPDTFMPSFNQLLLTPEILYSQPLEVKIMHNRMVNYRYAVTTINHMTDAQIDHFRSELQKWKERAKSLN
ncbi:DUF6279 family lipoprotein [Vibrio sp. TRT 21S02]|uniref:DUF6279 family lipoprotein n=1 Tax=Vibrio sp. TRT 21S02 TaxID=3418507 RepID=UPI003CE8E35C